MRNPPIALAALALVAACATPAPRPVTARVSPPPRSWTGNDLAAPRGPAVLPAPADSVARGGTRAGGYPDDRARQVYTSNVATPPESYRPSTTFGRTLRITEIPPHRILAVLPVLGGVPLRGGVWPAAARVVEHDSLGALIATEPLSLASLGTEVVCTGVTWDREVPVRLLAYVAKEGGAVVVKPRYSVGIPVGGTVEPECAVGVVGQDRVTAFALDVSAALRQAARMGMAVPIRPRP